MFKEYLHGTATLSGQALANADINGDGVQDNADMILLQKYISGKIDTFKQ